MGIMIALAIGYVVLVTAGAIVIGRARERGHRRRQHETAQMRRRLHHGLALTGISILAVDSRETVRWQTGPDIDAPHLRSSEATGHAVRDVFGGWDDAQRIVRSALGGRRSRAVSDFDEQVLEVAGTPIYGDDGLVSEAIVTVRDVTITHRETERAERLARMRSTALGTISHKIRGHLNGVLGMAELLRASSLSVQQRDWLDLSTGSSQQLLTFVDQLVELLELDAAPPAIEAEAFSIRELADQVVERHRSRARADGTTFAARYDLDLPDSLAGDRARIERAVDLMVSVALRTNAGGQVVVNVTEDDRTAEGATVVIAVEDRGRGLSPDALARMFDGLESPSAMWASRSEGTGLELPIARLLMRAMGGDLVVESQPGTGTTLRAHLHLGRAVAWDVDDHHPGPALVSFRREHLRVLVVDDSRVQGRVARSLLEQLGHEVTLAASGMEALKLLDQGDYDLVLTELHMPEIDGFELARRIAADKGTSGVPVAALTSDVRAELQQRASEAGMAGFFQKPVDFEVFAAALQRIDEAAARSQPEPDETAGSLDPTRISDLRALEREGDAEVTELIDVFLTTTPAQLVDAAEAVQRGDIVRLTTLLDLVHVSSELVGATRMEELCLEASQSLVTFDMNGARSCIEALGREFAHVRRLLTREFEVAARHSGDGYLDGGIARAG
jgi:signal transduction histidine kinase/CheY-like chemotaxis protein